MNSIIKPNDNKRNIAKKIVNYFPKSLNIYFEPSVGFGSVLGELIEQIESGSINCKGIVANDRCQEIIGVWNLIKSKPAYLVCFYAKRDIIFSMMDKQSKKDYYNAERDLFNKKRLNNEFDAEYYSLFFWLLQNSTSSTIKFNKKNQFIPTCQISNNPINAEMLEQNILEWSEMLNKHKVFFTCTSHNFIEPLTDDDFVYVNLTELSDEWFNYFTSLNCSYAYLTKAESPKSVFTNEIKINKENTLFIRQRQ